MGLYVLKRRFSVSQFHTTLFYLTILAEFKYGECSRHFYPTIPTTLKYQWLKFTSRMPVKRVWTKSINSVEYTTWLDVWDNGDIRYERFRDGIEKSWKIIDRQISSSGFTESLMDIPIYVTPTKNVWKESIPAHPLPGGGFQIPGWTVTCSGNSIRKTPAFFSS